MPQEGFSPSAFLATWKKTLFFALAVVVLLVVPTRPAGVADGLPVDHPLELWIALLLAGGFFVLPWKAEPRRAPRLALLLAVVAVAKMAVASISLPHGLLARYYANPDFRGQPEASVEYNIDGATRLDRTIDFAHVGFAWDKKPFPIWFFNDSNRFNLYKPGEPDRKRLPFSVRWDGFIQAPAREPFAWRLVTKQEATLSLMGEELLSTAEGAAEAKVALEPGWYSISLTYVHRGMGPRSLRLEWAPDGEFRPVPASALLPLKPSEAAERWDRRAASAAWAVFVFQFLAVAWILVSGLKGLSKESVLTERAAVFLMVALMAALGTASLAKRGRAPHWNILNGGDDPLVYETAARQILIQRDPLNRMPGSQPFYFTAGYRYLLAAGHAVMGPSKAMVVMLQYLLLALTCAPLYYIFKRLVPPWVALFAAVIFFSGHARESIYRWPTDLFPAVAALFLGAALLLQLGRCREGTYWLRHAGAGLLFGLACIMRPNILVFGPVAFVWLLFRRESSFRRNVALSLVFAITSALTIAPVTWRNWHVSGEFVLINKGGSINFWEGNMPPEDVDLSRVGSHPLYRRLGLQPKTQEALEFIRQRPLAFMAGLGRKACNVLGLPPYFSLSLLVLSAAYLLGAILTWLRDENRGLALLLHGFVLSQWAILILLKPWPHEPKNQLPTFIVAFPLAAVFLFALAERVFLGRSKKPFLWLTADRATVAERLVGGLVLAASLATLTYTPRLPIVVALLVGALWALSRKPAVNLFSLDE